MKIIVAIDFGTCRPNDNLLTRYDEDGKPVYIKTKDLPSVKAKTMVSFDATYLPSDTEDNSFLVAEFMGFIEDENDG